MFERRSRSEARHSRVVIALGALFAGTFVMGCAEVLVVGMNLLPALGAGLEAFIAARFVIGAAEGLFIAAAITTATAMVPQDRIGRAMAVVISGFAGSGVVGMPLGRLLGETVGWRVTFLAVALAAVVVLLIVPFVETVASISGPWVAVCLMGFGVAAAVGSFAGGRFADAGAVRAARPRDVQCGDHESLAAPCRASRRPGRDPRGLPARTLTAARFRAVSRNRADHGPMTTTVHSHHHKEKGTFSWRTRRTRRP